MDIFSQTPNIVLYGLMERGLIAIAEGVLGEEDQDVEDIESEEVGTEYDDEDFEEEELLREEDDILDFYLEESEDFEDGRAEEDTD